MRKLLVLIFYVFVSGMYSQDYKPLLDDYNEWNLRYCPDACTSDIYYTNGDTIVDGMNFKILDGYHYISRGFLLREDIDEMKVYLKAIINNASRDYLLYDFSLEVGDSIDIKNPITPFPEDAGYFEVDSIIPRPLVDGNEYRHFYLSPAISNTISSNNAIWVEGVGSLSLINAPGGDPDVNNAVRVACMFKNGSSFYSDLEIIDACEPTFVLSTDEFESNSATIQIIKRPRSNEFEIINIKPFKAINIFNLQGVKVSSYTLNNQNSIQLDLSNYQAALYLLIFESNEYTSQAMKIIVE